jgi:hypothetical protein
MQETYKSRFAVDLRVVVNLGAESESGPITARGQCQIAELYVFSWHC